MPHEPFVRRVERGAVLAHGVFPPAKIVKMCGMEVYSLKPNVREKEKGLERTLEFRGGVGI